LSAKSNDKNVWNKAPRRRPKKKKEEKKLKKKKRKTKAMGNKKSVC